MSSFLCSRTGAEVFSIDGDDIKIFKNFDDLTVEWSLNRIRGIYGMAGYWMSPSPPMIKTCATGHYKLSAVVFSDKCLKCPPGECTSIKSETTQKILTVGSHFRNCILTQI